MKNILGFIVVSLFITTFSYSNIMQKYSIGEKIINEVVLDKKIRMKLSDGEWEVLERTRWSYNAFDGQYILVAKINGKEIVETLSLGYIDTGGKRIADVNTFLYETVFTNKHDGCYEKPEYFLLKSFAKGNSHNCFWVMHEDLDKVLNNPDDPASRGANRLIKKWIKW